MQRPASLFLVGLALGAGPTATSTALAVAKVRNYAASACQLLGDGAMMINGTFYNTVHTNTIGLVCPLPTDDSFTFSAMTSVKAKVIDQLPDAQGEFQVCLVSYTTSVVTCSAKVTSATMNGPSNLSSGVPSVSSAVYGYLYGELKTSSTAPGPTALGLIGYTITAAVP